MRIFAWLRIGFTIGVIGFRTATNLLRELRRVVDDPDLSEIIWNAGDDVDECPICGLPGEHEDCLEAEARDWNASFGLDLHGNPL